jgi:hypothetical protein
MLPQYTPIAAFVRAVTEPRSSLVTVSLLGGSPAPPNAVWMLQFSLLSFDAAFVFIDISAPLSKSTNLILENELEAPDDRCRELIAHTLKCWRVRFDCQSEPERLTRDLVAIGVCKLMRFWNPRPDLETRILAVSAEALAGFKQPREIRFIPQLPKGLLDKTLKRELRLVLGRDQKGGDAGSAGMILAAHAVTRIVVGSTRERSTSLKEFAQACQLRRDQTEE